MRRLGEIGVALLFLFVGFLLGQLAPTYLEPLNSRDWITILSMVCQCSIGFLVIVVFLFVVYMAGISARGEPHVRSGDSDLGDSGAGH